MNRKLSAVLLVVAILGFGAACQKEVQLPGAVERIRTFAENNNPELRDEPLVVTLARKKGPCICIKVCTKSGKCTPCSCDPPKCGSCVSSAEVAPVDSVFEK